MTHTFVHQDVLFPYLAPKNDAMFPLRRTPHGNAHFDPRLLLHLPSRGEPRSRRTGGLQGRKTKEQTDSQTFGNCTHYSRSVL